MGEKIVRTEVGLQLCKQMAKELQETLKDKPTQHQNNEIKRILNEAEPGESSKRRIQFQESRKLISSICNTPQSNSNKIGTTRTVNFDNLWGVESSVDMINSYKNQILSNCKDQSSFQKYFSDKKISNPYIMAKVKNISEKMMPVVGEKHQHLIIRKAIKEAEKQKQMECEKHVENGYRVKNGYNFFNHPTEGNYSNKYTQGSENSTSQRSPTLKIYEKLKSINGLNQELISQRSQQLVYLEQRIEQLNLRQSKYEQYRVRVNQQVEKQLSDIKSYIYKPATLEEMKKVNNPSDILNYDHSFFKTSQKLALAKIHQRKYSENWKKQSEHRAQQTQHNNNHSNGFSQRIQTTNKMSSFDKMYAK